MKIITGSTGTAHVTSNNDGEFNQGIFGAGLVVLKNGYQLEAQIKDANTITIKDGDLVLQGRHALIEPGTTEDVTIMTGAVGMKRIDLIVARYTLDESTGYERITLEVITGEETEGTPVEPAYVQGDIRTGSLVAEMPLYRVDLNGINIESITAYFRAVEPIAEDVADLKIKEANREASEVIGVLFSQNDSLTIDRSKYKALVVMSRINDYAFAQNPMYIPADIVDVATTANYSNGHYENANYNDSFTITINGNTISLLSYSCNGWTWNGVLVLGVQ